MEKIPLPNLKTIKEESNYGEFEISPLYPGYGPTIANTLRRALLSSLPGSAVESFKIEGVEHEFSSIDSVKEDVVEIMLNLKKMRVQLLGEQKEAVLRLEKNKSGEVTASDFEKNSEVEILNPDQKIATLDKNGKINMTVNISHGFGYMPSEEKTSPKEIGLISLDSFYSPVRHVAFKIEDTRVGQATNFDKVTLTVETDNSIQPSDALKKSAAILTEHYALIANMNAAEELTRVKETLDKQIEETKEAELKASAVEENSENAVLPPLDSKMKIEDVDLSGRTKNALLASGFKTLSGLKRLSEIKLAGIKGLGAKGLDEVKELLTRVEN